jgi:hypothetical protein
MGYEAYGKAGGKGMSTQDQECLEHKNQGALLQGSGRLVPVRALGGEWPAAELGGGRPRVNSLVERTKRKRRKRRKWSISG